MKYKVTRKTLKDNHVTIIPVGYCELQDLLRFYEPESYCGSSTHGWRCDNYRVRRGVLLSTGYDPVSKGKVKQLGYKREQEINEMACNLKWDEKDKADELLEMFVSESIDTVYGVES